MLDRLLTEQGEKSRYDAVSQCSRCGYCEQACPTYVATGRETFSARGRNQLVRLFEEGRVADPAAVEEALSTCLLCGACQTVCPASVPTADIVLEGRRRLRGKGHWLTRVVTHLLHKKPRAFAELLRWANRFKRWGLAGLFARTKILSLLGLGALERAALHVDEAPGVFLFEELAEDPELRASKDAGWLYFAPCGPNYVLPRVGLATTAVMKRFHGKGAAMQNGCCGLLAYNYGDLEAAREAAQEVVRRFETLHLKEGGFVVGDCSSCVAHLKSYPQLFLSDPRWKARAEAFAARVKDAAQCLPAESVQACSSELSAYHDACRLINGQGVSSEPRAAMKKLCGASYRELPEASVCCGGAGAFAFVHPELSDALLKAKTGNLASTHARVVAATSTSCLLQLAHGLKKYYPEARVAHLTELVLEGLRRGP